jgi:hypothetical protein
MGSAQQPGLFCCQKRHGSEGEEKTSSDCHGKLLQPFGKEKTMAASNEELLKDDVLTDDSAIKDPEILGSEEIDEDDEEEEEEEGEDSEAPNV